MERDTRSQKFPIQSLLPEFTLKSVSGDLLGSAYLRTGKAALVVFTCNHCPYVQGSEDLLIAAINKYQPLGLRSLLICSNDAEKYPEDSFLEMQKRAKVKNYPCPYLHDETQEVAKLFDAACTPECFLFDSSFKLVYQGALTDNPRNKDAARKDLLSLAIESVLAGKPLTTDFNHPIGCSIKWK